MIRPAMIMGRECSISPAIINGKECSISWTLCTAAYARSSKKHFYWNLELAAINSQRSAYVCIPSTLQQTFYFNTMPVVCTGEN